MKKVRSVSQIVQNKDGRIRIEDVFRCDTYGDRYETLRNPLETERCLKARSICGIDDSESDVNRRI